MQFLFYQYLMILATVSRSGSLRIFLADDDEDDQIFFRESLESLGIKAELTMFNDGVELIDQLKNNPLKPDIIFLDLNMPKCNGVDCLTMIRKERDFAKVPVIIYSTSKQKNDIVTTYNLGANLYVKKPNDYQSLPQLLKRILSMNWSSTQPALDDFVLA